jgi:hypothetical protein
MDNTWKITKVREVAKWLGRTEGRPDWKLRPADPEWPDHRNLTIDGPDGAELWFGFDRYGYTGRIVIHGELDNELSHHVPYGEHTPSITVAETRTPDAIAREIKRRLLPAYRELLVKVRESKARNDEYEQQRDGLRDELLTALGEHGRAGQQHQRDGSINLYGLPGPVYGTVTVSRDSAAFEIRSAPRELALAIARVIGEWRPATD